MPYQTLEEFNRSGLEGLFVYTANVVPSFTPLLLGILFAIALLASYFGQKKLTGEGNFIASFAVAGYFIAIVAFIMSIVSGLINVATLAVCIVISIVGTVLLLTKYKT